MSGRSRKTRCRSPVGPDLDADELPPVDVVRVHQRAQVGERRRGPLGVRRPAPARPPRLRPISPRRTTSRQNGPSGLETSSRPNSRQASVRPAPADAFRYSGAPTCQCVAPSRSPRPDHRVALPLARDARAVGRSSPGGPSRRPGRAAGWGAPTNSSSWVRIGGSRSCTPTCARTSGPMERRPGGPPAPPARGAPAGPARGAARRRPGGGRLAHQARSAPAATSPGSTSRRRRDDAVEVLLGRRSAAAGSARCGPRWR